MTLICQIRLCSLEFQFHELKMINSKARGVAWMFWFSMWFVSKIPLNFHKLKLIDILLCSIYEFLVSTTSSSRIYWRQKWNFWIRIKIEKIKKGGRSNEPKKYLHIWSYSSMLIDERLKTLRITLYIYFKKQIHRSWYTWQYQRTFN